MTDENPTPEFSLVAPGTAITKRTRPVLTPLGDRLVPSDGRWHPDLVAEYIREHGGRRRWIPTGEIARVFFGGNTQSNRKRVRLRLYRVWQILLDQNLLLVIEVHPRDGAQACKIYDPRSAEEQQYLRQRLARMEKQKFLKAEQIEKALLLADCIETATAEMQSK